MLIGIDMLGVQSPDGVGRESSRLARQLVAALLGGDPAHRYVLYIHQGLPTHDVPSARNALRVSLPEGSEGPANLRPIVQRLLDHNPDDLDWLILLDPFHEGYGGLPPESPLNGVKVASIISDIAPTRVDDRRLAPLRRHDAILAYCESTAEECRRRMPTAERLISRIGMGVDTSRIDIAAYEPLSESTATELGRLGIVGPFLLANMAAGAERSNLGGVLDAYQRIAMEYPKGHQLVIAGEVDDPWAAVAYLHDQGCSEGLVLVGAVEETTLRTLYRTCTAFVSPSFGEASALSLIEAMCVGAPVVAGRVGCQPDVVGDAALLADPTDPGEIAKQVVSLLANVALRQELRRKAQLRSREFSWEPVAEEVLAVLQGDELRMPMAQLRFDPSRAVKSRIAVFAGCLHDRPTPSDFHDRVVRACHASYDVDLYFEPADIARLGRLPLKYGGFDARLFARNDAILDYHAVVYLLPDVFSLKSKIKRLRTRPGLVFFEDETSLDRIEYSPYAQTFEASDLEAEVACQRLHELFLTSSYLVVRCLRNLYAVRGAFTGFADRVLELPAIGGEGVSALNRRTSRGTEPLGALIDQCAVDMAKGPGRTRRKTSGPLLKLPNFPPSPGAMADADDSCLEAR